MKKLSALERAEGTPLEAYRSAQTAMAMAKSEAWALRGWMHRRMFALRKEADDIEALLTKATEHTDSWYDEIVARRDALANAERK